MGSTGASKTQYGYLTGHIFIIAALCSYFLYLYFKKANMTEKRNTAIISLMTFYGVSYKEAYVLYRVLK